MTLITRQIRSGLVLLTVLGWAGLAHADAVTDWNAIALQTIASAAAPHVGPPTIIDLAKVQAAVHDAVQAIEGRYEPYHAHIQGATGSSSAAAAKAAHDVLVGLFPAQQTSLDTTYDAYLVANGLAANDPGVAVGAQAAAALLALRANDGAFPNPPPPPFVGGTGIGEWRPTPSFLPGAPPGFSPMAAPWLPSVTPFMLESTSQFRAKAPPEVTSAVYTRHYREVKALGSLTSTERSAEQTDLAYFWSDNFTVQWNRVLRALAASQALDIADSARLFALANLATADAVMTAWDSKLHFNYWRPITAIQEGDNDGNPKTIGDPSWQSLINNPNYPDYTSGANNVTGAMTRTLQRFFETNEMSFSVTSNVAAAVQKTRTFTKFSDAAEEVVDARVLLGIHFRFADTAARRQGRRVADFAFTHYLRPIDGD